MRLLNQHAPEIIILGAITLIQISPLKINPWSYVALLIRRLVGTEDLKKSFHDMTTRIDALEKSHARTRSKVVRKEIIEFAEDLKRGKEFHLSEFEEMGRIINEYRQIIETHKFKNSYCEAQMDYIEEQMGERGVINADDE